jgi:hypothetical protein
MKILKTKDFFQLSQIIIFLFVFPFSIFSQRSELKVQYRIGTALNNFKTLDLPQDNSGFYNNNVRSIRSLNDQGVKVSFKYNFSKKYKLFFSLGFEKSFSKDYLHIFVPQPIENVILTQSRNVLDFGLKKQFSFFDDKLRLELGADITKRNPDFDFSSFSTDFQPTHYDWMKYSYEIDLFSDKPNSFPNLFGDKERNFNANYNLSILIPIKKRFILNFDIEYTRNLTYYYSYSYSSFILDDLGNITTINTFSNPTNYIKKNLLFVGIGLSYKFDFNKKLYSWLIN